MLDNIESKKNEQLRPKDLDIDNSPYIYLPPSPNKDDSDSTNDQFDIKKELFVCDSLGNKWDLKGIKELIGDERPSTYHKEIRQTKNNFLFIDKTCKSKTCMEKSASILVTDVNGNFIENYGLDFDIYRINSNPNGNYFVCLSSNSCLHVYNEQMKLLYFKDLSRDWWTQEILKSNLWLWGELKTKFKSIDISANGRGIYYSFADTIYFYEINSKLIWNATVPLKPNWERIYDKPDLFKKQPEIMDAINLMGLEFPIKDQMIKEKYRKLALEWHPDLRPDDPNSTPQMQKINDAFSLLTGVESNLLELDPNNNVLQFKRVRPDKVKEFERGMIILDLDYPGGLDWIYGGGISIDNESVYIGTYSGKAIKVNSFGNPEYTLDVGNVITHIFDNENYIYIFTHTRLYILSHEKEIIKIINISNLGKPTFFKESFIFEHKNKVCAYSVKGDWMFNVWTKYPIRKYFWKGEIFILETRTHQSKISK